VYHAHGAYYRRYYFFFQHGVGECLYIPACWARDEQKSSVSIVNETASAFHDEIQFESFHAGGVCQIESNVVDP
jgi:hypothetical protein